MQKAIFSSLLCAASVDPASLWNHITINDRGKRSFLGGKDKRTQCGFVSNHLFILLDIMFRTEGKVKNFFISPTRFLFLKISQTILG